MKNKNLELGNYIYKLRSEKGLSRKQLGIKVGLSVNAIMAIENGNSEPKIENLNKISRALDTKTSKILEEIGE